nr:hypothetical protein [Pandoravirus massiliensis]
MNARDGHVCADLHFFLFFFSSLNLVYVIGTMVGMSEKLGTLVRPCFAPPNKKSRLSREKKRIQKGSRFGTSFFSLSLARHTGLAPTGRHRRGVFFLALCPGCAFFATKPPATARVVLA